MKVTMISHASVLVEDGPIAILTDPWFMGEVFNESWSLLCEPALTPDTIQGITHIWISHEHPDHLHFPTLRAIPEEQKSSITLLYQEHFSPRVLTAIKAMGFSRVVELPDSRWVDVGNGASVMCYKVGMIDSLLAIRSGGITVLNMNDCVLDPIYDRSLARYIGPVDVLLTQFSIAKWEGNPGDTEVGAADELIARMRLYIETFKPEVTIPFASFVYFSHEENRHMNAWINTPDRISKQLADAPTQLQFLYNVDSWSSQHGFRLNGNPLDHYRADFQKICGLPYRSHPSYPLDELISLGQSLVDEVRASFPGFWLRWTAPIYFYLHDLDAVVRFDLRGSTVEADHRSKGECDLSLHSQALWYAFKFHWGFGTLGISGRYELVNPNANTHAMYVCEWYASGFHFRSLWSRLLGRRFWHFVLRRRFLHKLLRASLRTLRAS